MFSLEENVILDDSEVEWDENGKIIHHPLRSLYYFYDDGREPANRNELTFAGDHLDRSQILNDLKMYDLIFHGEPQEVYHREAWADPLRADVLHHLTGKGRSWYLSFVSDITIKLIDRMNKPVPRKLNDYYPNDMLQYTAFFEEGKFQDIIDYFSQKNPAQMTTINSGVPFGFGKGLEKRLFFEVPNQEIDKVASIIWPGAWAGYAIQGYNFESGRIDLLDKWGKKAKDEYLFREIMDQTQVFFYTWPAEHNYFQFLTNKYTFDEFQQAIQLEDMRRKARILLKNQFG